jgi:uncharacterized integral membrane protein
MLSLIRTLGLFAIAIVAAFFFIQNLATIEVAFLTWSISAPRAVIFLMVFGMGLIAGYLLHALRPRQHSGRQSSNAEQQDGPPAPDNAE